MNEKYLAALRQKVLDQIEVDVNDHDLTAIDELLPFIPTENLEGYLHEEDVAELKKAHETT